MSSSCIGGLRHLCLFDGSFVDYSDSGFGFVQFM